MTTESVKLDDLPASTEEQKPEGEAQPGETPQTEGGEPQTPQAPAEDPRIAALQAQMAEMKADRDRAFALAEKYAPKEKQPEPEPEEDLVAEIEKDYEDGPTKQALLKIAKGLERKFEKKLAREVGSVRHMTEAQQMEQRAYGIEAGLLKEGFAENEVLSIRNAAVQSATAARQRGERPDLDASYKAAAYDALMAKQRKTGDAEQANARELAAKRANGSTPAGMGAPPGQGKISLDQIKAHVGKKKDVPISEILRMHDEAGKK
jgi:hypothetical protein